MDTDSMCNPVSDKRTYDLSITLRDHGGKTVADWELPTTLQPHYGELVLYLDKEEKGRHLIKESKGSVNLGETFGVGYRLAFLADDFAGKKIEVFATDTTERGCVKLSASKQYEFAIELSNFNNQARMTWSSTAPFRPRTPNLAQVFANGQREWSQDIAAASGHADTKVRWGVELDAAYRVHDFNGREIDLLRTPKTRAC